MDTQQISTDVPALSSALIALFSPIGKMVNVNGRIGQIVSVGISPYWPESKDMVIRAYVVSANPNDLWTDYLLPTELHFV